ncbi:MAG: preprotein translocase subunit YajC [Bacteroidales bacterium]|nr:preprotein translocase subunit YajC [Bacteroidales bacterium]
MPTQGSGMSMFVMLGLFIVVMYFFMIRPQSKRQKELAQFRNELKQGDKVVTLGGIHGTVKVVTESTIILTISENVDICVEKTAIIKDPSEVSQA